MTATAELPWTETNGVVIVHGEHNSYGVGCNGHVRPLKLEVDYLGRRYKEDWFSPAQWYRDRLDVDVRDCVIRVLDNGRLLAQLGEPPQGHMYQPWMVWQGPQAFVSENYVSIPPALRIIDETGALWTLGFDRAPKEQAPDGEFAFSILRNAVDMHEFASRIERRNGKIRIFTRRGWLVWNGRTFT